MAALASNAQCYGNCATADCAPVQQTPSSSCHHHKVPANEGVCQHQHASIAGPESGTGLFKATPASTPLLSDLPVLSDIASYAAVLAPVSPHSGSPPRSEGGSVGVLRI